MFRTLYKVAISTGLVRRVEDVIRAAAAEVSQGYESGSLFGDLFEGFPHWLSGFSPIFPIIQPEYYYRLKRYGPIIRVRPGEMMTKTRHLTTNHKYITILLVDDDQQFRGLVKRLLEKDTRLRVAGEANDGAEAIELAKRLTPDIILMDLAMPGTNGLEATRRIKGEHPRMKVIIYTQYAEEAYHRAATDSGADSFLSKRTRLTDLLATIRQVADEKTR